MKNNRRKRGQKFIRRFSRVSVKASEEGKEHIKENLIDRISHIANIRLLIVEWSLLVIALIMLAITQAFWFGNSYAEDTFTDGGTYTEATVGEVKTLNPLFATTNSEKALGKLMFTGLVTDDYSGHVGLALAESITSNDEANVWTVRLKKDLKWSDGEPLTRDDVIFTAELIKNPAANTIYDSNLLNVKIEEGDSDSIIFTLPRAYADFDTALNFPILPKHILDGVDMQTINEHSFSSSPICSGAFSFNAMQSAAKESEKIFYLSANPYYYGGKSMLNSFAVHTFETKDDIISAINSATVTATAELSGKETERVNTAQFNVNNSNLNSGAFIFFNTSRENIKNTELRSAIREGIDVSKIREVAPDTLPLDYPILPSQITLSKYPDLPLYNFNQAKEKIAALSPEGAIHLDVVTVDSGYLPEAAGALKEQLENLGFEVNLVVHDESQGFISEVISKRSYDILVYDIELGSSPDLLPYYHSSQAKSTGFNLSNFKNVLADDLLLGARDASDEELKMKKYESFLEHWVSGVPAIGLYQTNLTYFYNKNARAYGDDVNLVTSLDRFVDVNSWAVVKETKNKTP